LLAMRLVVLAGVVVMKTKISVDAHRERVTLASQLNFSERLSGPTALGFVKLYFVRDWSGAEVGFRRAITIDPSYAATHPVVQRLSARRRIEGQFQTRHRTLSTRRGHR
jgi:hypothetical protein